MGKIITLQDGLYNYETPTMPTREEDILFYDLPKADQHWRIPPRKNVRRISQSEVIEYVEQERDRWANGVWFFNNGEPTYITGMHYDHLVNMRFDFGHAEYYDQQREDFYMRDLARKDKNCFGVVWLKPRRYGMTAEELTQAIYSSMEDFNLNVGLMSNEGTKAISTLMQPIVNAVMYRPVYSRPIFYKPSGKKPRKALEFADGQVDFDDSEIEHELRTLGGIIKPYNTTPAAMDGEKKAYIVMDEVWKWTGADPDETLGINKKCVEIKGIAGKISMLSTMGDSDDYGVAIKAGIKVWNDSNPDVRDGNGRTTSGLYRYFVSAIHSKTLPAEFTNKYGKVDAGRAEEFILNDRAKFTKGTKSYIFEMRRMPLKASEALASANSEATYDVERHQRALDELNKLPKNRKPYVRGNFIENSMGKVVFEPNEEGLWKKAHDPFWQQNGKDYRNHYRRSGRKIKPPKQVEFVIGYDPVRYGLAQTKSKNLSRAAAVVRQKYDYYGNGMAGRYAALLVYRPLKSADAHEQVLLAAKYYGAEVNPERQVETVYDYFEAEQALDVIMDNPDDGKKGLWTDSNRKVIKSGVEFITNDVAMEEGSDHDPITLIPFEEIHEERISFDPTNTSPFDVEMADIMCHHGCRWLKESSGGSDDDDKKKTIRAGIFAKRAA